MQCQHGVVRTAKEAGSKPIEPSHSWAWASGHGQVPGDAPVPAQPRDQLRGGVAIPARGHVHLINRPGLDCCLQSLEVT